MMTVSKPGVYSMPDRDYHADPCPRPSLSASTLRAMIYKTPAKARIGHPKLNPNWVYEHDSKFDIGNAAHALVLRDPKEIVICPFDDWKKGDAKKMRDEAWAENKIPLLAHQHERVVQMAEAARAQLAVHEDASGAFLHGDPEQTIVWTEEYPGLDEPLWCRARPDWLHKPLTDIFDDYKSTECADPKVWQGVAFGRAVGHDISAAWYRRGIRALRLCDNPRMRYIVQETGEPWALCAIELEEDAIELADRKVRRGVDAWAWCMKNGIWPGYPAYTVKIGAPSWHEESVLSREIEDAGTARQRGRQHSVELLEFALKMQGPV